MKQTCLAARLIFLTVGLGTSSWAPMIPFAKRRLGLDDAELGGLLLMCGLGALSAMPITGWLVQRMGSRMLIAISGLLMVLILPFLTVVSNTTAMSFLLVLFGVATSVLNVSINSQAVVIEKNCGQALMSGFHCFSSVGGFLGALIVSGLLEWGVPLFACGLTMALVIAPIVCFQSRNLLPKSLDAPASATTATPQQKFRLPEAKVFFLGFLCLIAFVSEGSMLDWSAEFMRSSLNYGSAAGVGYMLFSLSMGLGRFFGDRVINRFGTLTVFQAGSFLAASGFLVMVYATWGYAQLLGFVLIGLGGSNIVPMLFSASGKIRSSSPSQVLSVITTIAYTGMLVGPATIGFVAESFSLSFAFSGIAFLLVGVGLCGKVLEGSVQSETLQPQKV